jgi:WhiB family redox-sensing transcriptional regulator
MPAAVRAELRRQIADGWGRSAACASPRVDPDWWFTPASDERQTVARGTCDSCPVRRSCLAYALVMEESDGIWGGFDESERTWMRLAVAEGTRVAAVLDLATRTAAA